LAETVPSEPSPKKIARRTSSASMSSSVSQGSELPETSSRMPMVKRDLGAGFPSSAKTALAIAGVNSLLERP
jgi:hypothetical protein